MTDISKEQGDAVCDLIAAFRAAKRLNLKIVSVHGLLFAMNEDVDVSGMSCIEADSHPETCRLYGQLSR